MQTLPIINKGYEIYKAIVQMNYNLEKRWKYSLGMSLENSVLIFLDQVIMAKNAPKPMKAAYLIHASSSLETATLKLRLFLELKISNETKIFQIQALLQETGRMLGGWLRSAHT